MQAVNFDEVLEKILIKDRRYQRDAYVFVRESLDHTQKLAAKSRSEAPVETSDRLIDNKPHHVTGQQLLEGIRHYALEQFGPMAQTVLHEWGVRTCEDFGEIVFNMVESNLLAKTKKDTREHFRGGSDFFDAFRRPFLPSHPHPTYQSDTRPTQV